jgi:hypothetical protein
VLTNYVNGMIEMITSQDLKPALDSIVPAIKDRQYLDFLPDGSSKIVHEHLAGDLYVVYCEDNPHPLRR